MKALWPSVSDPSTLSAADDRNSFFEKIARLSFTNDPPNSDLPSCATKVRPSTPSSPMSVTQPMTRPGSPCCTSPMNSTTTTRTKSASSGMSGIPMSNVIG